VSKGLATTTSPSLTDLFGEEFAGSLAQLLQHFANRTKKSQAVFPKHVLTEIPQPLLKCADQIVALNFELASEPVVAFGDSIDWAYDPTPDPRRRWSRELHRHRWVATLAEAYRTSGDERYAKCFAQLIEHWIQQNPVLGHKDEADVAWTLMGVGMRSMIWPTAFEFFSKSNCFEPPIQELMLRSIHDHGEFLYRHKTSLNHLLREANGLLHLAARFPEYCNAEQWWKKASTRLAAEIHGQINPDGSHVELSPAYQWLVVEEFSSTLEILRDPDCKFANAAFEAKIQSGLQALLEYLAIIVRPDFTWPQINDGFYPPADELLGQLQDANCCLDSKSLNYVATKGAAGTGPTRTSFANKFSGLVIFRSDWTKQANYLSMNTGQFGGAHGHEDHLSIEVYAKGAKILVDPGTYTYNIRDPFRSYFVSSNAHNTVVVDGMSQARRWRPKNRAIQIGHAVETIWCSGPGYAYAEATYSDGYQNYGIPRRAGLWLARDIKHRRRILFVDNRYWLILDHMSAFTPRRYARVFQCAAGIEATLHNNRAQLTLPDGAGLALLWAAAERISISLECGSTDPIAGWVSSGTRNQKTPATRLLVAAPRQRNVCLVTLLCPTSEDRLPKAIELETLRPDTGKGLALRIKFADGQTEFCETILVAEKTGLVSLGDLSAPQGLAGYRHAANGRVDRIFGK